MLSTSSKSIPERKNSGTSSCTKVLSTSPISKTVYKCSKRDDLLPFKDAKLSKKLSGLNQTPQRKKFVIIGDGGIGKTSLLTRYSTGVFAEEYIPTVFQNTNIVLDVSGKIYDLVLWDTAGQDDYSRIRYLSYSDVDCFILCFALDMNESFANIESKWIPELHHHTGKNVPIILVGLKKDLRTTYPEYCLPYEMGKDLVTAGKVQCYLECSAMEDLEIDNVIEAAILTSNERDGRAKKKNCKMM